MRFPAPRQAVPVADAGLFPSYSLVSQPSPYFGSAELLGDPLPPVCARQGCLQHFPRLAFASDGAGFRSSVLLPDHGLPLGVLLEYRPGSSGGPPAFTRFLRMPDDDSVTGLQPLADSRIAVNPAGDVALMFISTSATAHPTARLMLFDRRGEMMAGPVDVLQGTWLRAMKFDAAGNLYLVYGRLDLEPQVNATSVAKLDRALTPIWVHSERALDVDSTALPRTLDATISADGEITFQGRLDILHTETGEHETESSEPRLVRLGPDGRVTRQLAVDDADLQHHWGGSPDGGVVRATHFDSDGIAFDPSNSGTDEPNPGFDRLRIVRFDAALQPLWHLDEPVTGTPRVERPWEPAASTSPLVAEDGSIYVATGVGQLQDYRAAALHVSADGTECSLTRLPLPEGDRIEPDAQGPINELLLGPDGLLYALGKNGMGVYDVTQTQFVLP